MERPRLLCLVQIVKRLVQYSRGGMKCEHTRKWCVPQSAVFEEQPYASR